MNPGSQVKCTLFGNTVESPEEEPFIGTDKRPQSTAKMCLIKQVQLGSELNVSAPSASYLGTDTPYACNNHKHIRLRTFGDKMSPKR